MRNWIALATLLLSPATVVFGQRSLLVDLSPQVPQVLPGPTVDSLNEAWVIVGMDPGGQLSMVAGILDGQLIDSIPGPAPLGLIALPRSSSQLANQVAFLPGVAFVEPVRRLSVPQAPGCNATVSLPVTLPAAASGAPPFAGSGCIAFFDGDPTPSEYFDQPALAALDVTAVHPFLSGTISTVAVIDTGIDATHPVLLGRVLPGGFDFVDRNAFPLEKSDGIDNDLDGLVDEAYGHGTHIAGTIVLLNPDARILPLRVLDSDGNGSSFAVAEAIYYAIASGADVINLSLGMDGESLAVRDAIDAAHDANIVVVAAAGNGGEKLVQFPARESHVLAIAAVDEFDTKAPFSSFGKSVEFSAPGVNIYSAMPGDQYAWWSGTSMATSVVSGAVSLLHSLSGDPFDTDADDFLEETSKSIQWKNPGFKEYLGEGRIDPVAAAFELISEL